MGLWVCQESGWVGPSNQPPPPSVVKKNLDLQVLFSPLSHNANFSDIASYHNIVSVMSSANTDLSQEMTMVPTLIASIQP